MIQYLVAHLNAHAGLSALVGSRIYPLILPQSPTLPAVTFQQISRVPVHDRSMPDTLVTTRWQWNVNARTYATALPVMAQLKIALQAFSRSSAPRVEVVWLENEFANDEPDVDENNYYQITIDSMIWHEEA
jgi:hypothetical protein